jgi:hypothetical protein
VSKCINTWLPATCKDNTDSSCYCTSSNVTNSIIQCIQSWATDASEIQSALSYFTGICSGYIGSNPAIVSAIPKTITLAPPAPSATGVSPAGAPAPAVPCTTITYASTILTVPQVAFTTASGTAPSVGLIPAPSAPPAGASPSGVSPVGVPAGSTTLATSYGVPAPTGARPSTTPTTSGILFPGAATPGASAANSLWLAGLGVLLFALV